MQLETQTRSLVTVIGGDEEFKTILRTKRKNEKRYKQSAHTYFYNFKNFIKQSFSYLQRYSCCSKSMHTVQLQHTYFHTSHG